MPHYFPTTKIFCQSERYNISCLTKKAVVSEEVSRCKGAVPTTIWRPSVADQKGSLLLWRMRGVVCCSIPCCRIIYERSILSSLHRHIDSAFFTTNGGSHNFVIHSLTFGPPFVRSRGTYKSNFSIASR